MSERTEEPLRACSWAASRGVLATAGSACSCCVASRSLAWRMAAMYAYGSVSAPSCAIVAALSSMGNCAPGVLSGSTKGSKASPKWLDASRGSSAGKMSTPSMRRPSPSRPLSLSRRSSTSKRKKGASTDVVRTNDSTAPTSQVKSATARSGLAFGRFAS